MDVNPNQNKQPTKPKIVILQANSLSTNQLKAFEIAQGEKKRIYQRKREQRETSTTISYTSNNTGANISLTTSQANS